MGRLIIILAIAFGAVYFFMNQEEILNKSREYIKIDRKIHQLKNLKDKEYKFFGEELLFKENKRY